MTALCKARTKSGSCQHYAVKGTDYCYAHGGPLPAGPRAMAERLGLDLDPNASPEHALVVTYVQETEHLTRVQRACLAAGLTQAQLDEAVERHKGT